MRPAAKSIPPPRPPAVIVVGKPNLDLERATRHAGQIAFVDDIEEDACFTRQDIVVVRPDSAAAPERAIERLAQLPIEVRPRVVVSGDVAEGSFRTLIEHHEVAHVMAWRDAAADADLLITLEKLLSNDLFGMGRYFDEAGDPSRFTCQSALQRDELLAWLRSYAARHRVRSRLIDVLVVAADEMLTNALYNAPTDGDGKHIYASTSRQVPVTLESPSRIDIEVRCDGKRLGLSTVDPFGSLRPEVVLASLRRCFHRPEPRPDSSGGAGLGLYLLLGSLSNLIFHVAVGKRTEVIGLIDITGPLGRAATAGKSFNIFVER